MSKNCVLALYLLGFIYQWFQVFGAPITNDDQNSIIVIPFRSSEKQITKIDSFKIDGATAIKQLSSRVSAERILRTLSNIPEFSILAEGLDAITLGDVYKTAFPNGILYSIREKYLRSPTSGNSNVVIITPDNLEHENKSTIIAPINAEEEEDVDKASVNDIEYDDVNEDEPESSMEDLKEEPITDDYVYDQPIEDRFSENREYETENDDEHKTEDSRDSKNMKNSLNGSVIEEEKSNKELSKYGAKFRDWMTKFLTG